MNKRLAASWASLVAQCKEEIGVWSLGKIPHDVEQLSPYAATIEPALQNETPPQLDSSHRN